MRQLNRQYRGVDRTTDVLSFPQHSAEELKSRSSGLSGGIGRSRLPLGDVVINLHKAARQALEYGSTFDNELKRLLIHGLLHLIGYDHEKGISEERRMKKKSEQLFVKIK